MLVLSLRRSLSLSLPVLVAMPVSWSSRDAVGIFWKPTFHPNHRARNPHPGDGLDPLLGPRIFRALRLGPFEGFPAGSLEPPVPAKGSDSSPNAYRKTSIARGSTSIRTHLFRTVQCSH